MVFRFPQGLPPMPGAERRHYADAGKRAKDAACGPAARRPSDEHWRTTRGLLGTSAASQPEGKHRRVGSAGSAKRLERRMRSRQCVFPARQLIGLNSGIDPGMPDWIRGARNPMNRYVQRFFKGVFDRVVWAYGFMPVLSAKSTVGGHAW